MKNEKSPMYYGAKNEKGLNQFSWLIVVGTVIILFIYLLKIIWLAVFS